MLQKKVPVPCLDLFFSNEFMWAFTQDVFLRVGVFEAYFKTWNVENNK